MRAAHDDPPSSSQESSSSLHDVLGPFYESSQSKQLAREVQKLEAQDISLRDIRNPACCSRYHFADQLGLPLTGPRPIEPDELRARSDLCDLMHSDHDGIEIYGTNRNESQYKLAPISRGDYCNRFVLEKTRQANLFFNWEEPSLQQLRQAYPGPAHPDH